jgi:hypothetical protein
MANQYLTLSDPATRLGKAYSQAINNSFAAVVEAFDKLPSPTKLQANMVAYAETSGSSGNYAATVTPWPDSLSEGQRVRVKVNHTNPGDGEERLGLNGFTSLPIRDNQGATLAQGMMVAGTIVTLTYVSGRWQLDQIAAVTIPADESVSTQKLASQAVSNSKLSNMAAATFKGRATGAGTGQPQDLTPAQARTILDLTNAAVSFYRGNILGSVEQSGGTPTGALIETGSSANGKFTRFASGLQICRIGNLVVPYNSATDCLASWTFTSAFSSAIDGELVVIPTLIPSAASGNTTGITNRAGLGPPQIGALSTSSCHVRVNRITGASDFSAGQSVNVSLLAIGPWF